MGDAPASNLDSSGNVITNPQTANRGNYTLFCGFLCACHGAMHIIGDDVP